MRSDIFLPVSPNSKKTRRVLAQRRDLDAFDPSTPLTEQSPAGGFRWAAILLPALVLLVLIGAQLVNLQVVQGETFRRRAEANRIRVTPIPAPRGQLIDRHGVILAENLPNFVFSIVPADLPNDETAERNAILKAAEVAGYTLQEISQILAEASAASPEPIVLREHIPYEEALRLIVQTAEIPGLLIQSVPTRSYPLGSDAAHALGYIGKVTAEDQAMNPDLPGYAWIGRSGLERSYDRVLAGTDGVREIERDASNRPVATLADRPAVPGRSLELYVDAELQTLTTAALQQSIRAHRSTGGAAVILDPKTGGILALASAPVFDNNWFVSGQHANEVREALGSSSKPLLNRAVSGEYPSGSTIKPILAAAGLDAGVITPSTSILSTGGIQIGNNSFPDWKPGGHGATNVRKAIAESVNTFFYVLGGGDQDRAGLGVDRMVDYLTRFGWGTRLGVDLPAEANGLLPTQDWRATHRLTPWRLGDTYHLSIGQGDLQVTPLQVAASVAAIANGGTLFQPTFVKAIIDPLTGTREEIKPKVIRDRIVASAHLATVRQGMRDGVLTGSSRALQSLPVTAAGKTGTAQFGNQGKTHAWFSVYAPAEDPELVMVVIVESGGEGHAAALPVAQTVLTKYFTPDQNP